MSDFDFPGPCDVCHGDGPTACRMSTGEFLCKGCFEAVLDQSRKVREGKYRKKKQAVLEQCIKDKEENDKLLAEVRWKK